jgi:hypothetical protein
VIDGFTSLPILKYHMKILIGDSITKAGTQDIFKPTIRNDSLLEISSDNGIRVVHLVTLKKYDHQKYNPSKQ